MKRELISKEEAEKRGLVFTGICSVGSMTKKDKDNIIKSADKEENKTNIACYPVILDGYHGYGLYVYADPVYEKLSSYYIFSNFAEIFMKEFMSYEEKAHDAFNLYKSNNNKAKELKKELLDKGVKF